MTSRQSNGDCPLPAKQNKTVLSIEQKLAIIDLLHNGASCSAVMDKYGIGRSSIADIKKSEGKVRRFKWRITEMGIRDVKVKAMKLGSHEKLDEGLNTWFWQQWEKDVLVTRVLLQKKAKLLYQWLYPDATTHFSVSTGFRSWFMKRHNLHCIYIQGQQASADNTQHANFSMILRSLWMVMIPSKCSIAIRQAYSIVCYPTTL